MAREALQKYLIVEVTFSPRKKKANFYEKMFRLSHRGKDTNITRSKCTFLLDTDYDRT